MIEQDPVAETAKLSTSTAVIVIVDIAASVSGSDDIGRIGYPVLDSSTSRYPAAELRG